MIETEVKMKRAKWKNLSRPAAICLLPFAFCLLPSLFLAGCSQNPGGAGGYQTPPPEVGVVTIAPESVALTTELPGRIDPVRVAQVRARVDGIVLHRNFREGADVTNGEVLYEIDPAPYKAALDSANAT